MDNINIQKTSGPATVASVRAIIGTLFPALRRAVYEEARLVVPPGYPDRGAQILNLADLVYRRLMNDLRAVDFVVITRENGTGEQIVVYRATEEQFVPNHRRIHGEALVCFERLQSTPTVAGLYLG